MVIVQVRGSCHGRWKRTFFAVAAHGGWHRLELTRLEPTDTSIEDVFRSPVTQNQEYEVTKRHLYPRRSYRYRTTPSSSVVQQQGDN